MAACGQSLEGFAQMQCCLLLIAPFCASDFALLPLVLFFSSFSA
jgi:hypothetical protein